MGAAIFEGRGIPYNEKACAAREARNTSVPPHQIETDACSLYKLVSLRALLLSPQKLFQLLLVLRGNADKRIDRKELIRVAVLGEPGNFSRDQF